MGKLPNARVGMPFCHLVLRTPYPAPRRFPDAPSQLGGQIKARRREAGLSRKDLALRLGVTRDAVRAWETGRANPGAKRYPAVVAFLGFEPGVGETASVGAAIRAARRRQGLTQAALAARLGVTEVAVWHWERRATLPRRARSMALIEGFLREAAKVTPLGKEP
ncbi:MAG TPA: helix-turn-helix transcriptional regulator [Thermoanaerobaculia bacterium]